MSGYDPQHDIIAGETIKSGRDLFTRTVATAQAAELNTWWHLRGYPTVEHWVEQVPLARYIRPSKARRKGGVWVVRSNLVSGLPPKPAGG
jgi:hypothetical protein